ncbi:MAG: DUF2185 domain-containing protein [Bacteroidota bacterium]
MKKFKKSVEELQERIIPPMGYCFASDHITVDGLKVGYMYREKPDNDQDSGWRFFSGEEDDAYVNDLDHVALYDVNTIAHYDRAIIPWLESPYGSAFGRNKNGLFEEESFDPPNENE